MTTETGVLRNAAGQFLKGSEGLGGRQRGSRNKLGDAFLKALEADFAEHGEDTIKTVRAEKPDVYLKVIAGLLPSEHNLNINNSDELSDDEIVERIRNLAAIAQPLLGGTGIALSDARATAPTNYAGSA